MMLRLALPLVLTLLFAPAFTVPAAAAEPSFDCRTAKTARELATCNDAKLAAADRELAAAWREAIARFDSVTAKALREDQRKFLSDIDDGFDAELWGKQEAPEGKELRAQVAQLRRGGDYDALAALEAQLRERIAFLRNLTPAASFTGLWKNHDSEFLVAAGDNGRYRATYASFVDLYFILPGMVAVAVLWLLLRNMRRSDSEDGLSQRARPEVAGPIINSAKPIIRAGTRAKSDRP